MTDNKNASKSFLTEIRNESGINAARCYQCGKCSAGCPMAVESELRPHDILRMIQSDMRKEVLENESIWLCLTCETCTARCPNDCDPARVIDSLRELSIGEGIRPPRHIAAFHKSFLQEIRRFGRIFEFEMIAAYKMRSGALFSDVFAAPGMFGRGKLALTPTKISGVNEIRRIFDACSKQENLDGGPEHKEND